MPETIVKKFGRKILSPFLGKFFLQDFYEQLQLLGMKGRNFGMGSMLELSGEQSAIITVANRLKAQGLSKPVVFDVGANIGEYSLFVDKIFSRYFKDFHIFSFEPAVSIYSELKKKTSSVKHIQPINAGLSNSSQSRTLFINKQFNATSSLYKENLSNFDLKIDVQEQVTLFTLDLFCEQNNISKINFLKIDTEGHELLVLGGAKKMLASGKISFIQFEMGRTSINARVFFKDFFELLTPQYQLYRILKNGLQPINIYKETDEVFLTTNYLAELRKP